MTGGVHEIEISAFPRTSRNGFCLGAAAMVNVELESEEETGPVPYMLVEGFFHRWNGVAHGVKLGGASLVVVVKGPGTGERVALANVGIPSPANKSGCYSSCAPEIMERMNRLYRLLRTNFGRKRTRNH